MQRVEKHERRDESRRLGGLEECRRRGEVQSPRHLTRGRVRATRGRVRAPLGGHDGVRECGQRQGHGPSHDLSSASVHRIASSVRPAPALRLVHILTRVGRADEAAHHVGELDGGGGEQLSAGDLPTSSSMPSARPS